MSRAFRDREGRATDMHVFATPVLEAVRLSSSL